MNTNYLKINMDIVRKTIKDNGYYYIRAEKLFDDHYTGPQLYIVTDNINFAAENPELANMVILTVEQFEPIANAVNQYIANDDRERHRFEGTLSCDDEEYSLAENELDDFEHFLTAQQIKDALTTLNDVQKRRVIMYFFEGKTLLEIAKSEGVSLFAVQKSIDSAIKN